MKNEDQPDDFALFKAEVTGITKLKQETIFHNKHLVNKLPKQQNKRMLHENIGHEFYFSDEFVPLLIYDSPTRYVREEANRYELKKLRKGIYHPDVFLDLHGITKAVAKRELAALISYCMQENILCACVQHGIGTYVLKQKVPHWLAQHPDVMAFHQAPLRYGGHGALLVLFNVIVS